MQWLGFISFSKLVYFPATLSHPGLIEHLKEEKFDAAFYELMDLCGAGRHLGIDSGFTYILALFHLAGIEKFALTFSMASFEGSFHYTGVPTISSYIPGLHLFFEYVTKNTKQDQCRRILIK